MKEQYFKYEAGMQKWLSKNLIDSEGMLELLNEEFEPYESSSLAEGKIIESYSWCINSLGLTETISEDENISLKDGEILKPDFLLYAPETESIVIVELKNSGNASRQAGTELGAYTAEVKAYLPFISEGNVVHVIISPVWKTLLKRYVFNEIFWLGRKVICLEPCTNDADEIRLKVVPPSELIADDVEIRLSSEHLRGHQLCLYDWSWPEEGGTSILDKHIEQMKMAIAVMAQKGASLGSHGFAFLWKDFRSRSRAPYSITVVYLSPFKALERFLHSPDDEVLENSKITDKFLSLASEYPSIGAGETDTHITSFVCDLLKGVCSPTPEGFLEWKQLKSVMMENSELLEFHGWGMFSDLMMDMVSREYQDGNQAVSYTDPNLGLKLLSELIDPEYVYICLLYTSPSPRD